MDIERLVIDSSAIVAMAMLEPGHKVLQEKAVRAAQTFVAAPGALESIMVLSSRLSQDPRVVIAGFLEEIGAELAPFGEDELRLAAEAFLRFGKGRHQARLNILDCIAYATAVQLDAALLFTGEDFAKTDVAVA